MAYLDTLYLSDTVICTRCGTDLLIDEATFCPMCGEVRVPGRQAPTGAELPEVLHPGAAAPPVRTEGLLGSPTQLPARAEPPARPEPEAADPQAPLPVFDTVDDDVVADGQWADSRDDTGATERPAPPPSTERQAEKRHRARARLSSLSGADLLAAGGSATVAASLFLPWFQQQAGRVVIPGLPSFSTAQAVVRTSDAFGAGLWHWVICVISVLVVGYVAARILPGRNARLPLPHWQMLTVATVLNAGLVLMSVGLPPDSGHWSLGVGAELAVIASLIALGGAILRHGYPEVITRGRPRRTGRAARSTLAVRKVRPDRPTRAVRSAGARRGADPERAARNKRPEPKPRAEGNARPERRPRPEHNRRAERNTRSEGVRRTEQERRAEGETRAELGESTDFSTSSGSESPIYSFSTRAMATARQTMPEMDDDLECRFCGTLNNSSARVCRGCGVVTTVRLER